jgi:hypothetical protein
VILLRAADRDLDSMALEQSLGEVRCGPGRWTVAICATIESGANGFVQRIRSSITRAWQS